MQQLARILGEPTHNYKDRIFRMLVNDKKVALEIYNAMNGTQYSDPDKLTITTLENAVYMGDEKGHRQRWCPSKNFFEILVGTPPLY